MKSQDVFRENVRDLLNRRGLKVKDLADMVGLSPSYLSLVLSGDRANLSDHHKDAIALALGTSVAELYSPAAPGSGAPIADHAAGVPGRLSSEPGLAGRLARDISPFEDLLRVLNVNDRLLSEAYYRELNSLSDDDVRKLGGMLRNVLSGWQKAVRESKAEALAAATDPIVEPDHRTLLWLISYLSSLIGDVPMAVVSEVLSWRPEKLHESLEALFSSGVAGVVAGAPDEGRDSITLRALSHVDLPTLAQWISPERRRTYLLAAAKALQPSSAARPEHLAQIYLEGGDLSAARDWYGQAAIKAVDSGMWRLAKTYLTVASSLDTILGVPAADRVSTVQMLVTTCQNLGEMEEALAYQERNLAFWEQSGSPSDLLKGLLAASSILARKREWGRAGEYLDRALALSSKDFSSQARVRLGIAAVLSERGLFQRCREEYDKVLDLALKTQEEGIMAHALLGLGKVFLWRKDYQKSAQYLNRVLSLSEKREIALEVLARTEMGKLRFHEGSFALAAQHLEKALKAAAEISNRESENTAKAWLSRCLGRGSAPEDPRTKSDLAASALEFFRLTGERHGLVASLLAWAESESAMGRPAEAEVAFGEAVSEGRLSENPVLEALACEAYGEHMLGRDAGLAQVMLERSRWARSKIR